MTPKPVRVPEKLAPTAGRPRFPQGYGIPKDPKGMLPWSFVEDRMTKARNYWISTIRPDGTPHVRPVDGVWLDSALCFGGAPETRWVRNLTQNPAASVHLGREVEVVILEGTAQYITDAKHPLVAPLLEASRKKYPEYYSGSKSPFRPFWMFRPQVVFAWTLEQFPKSATRWVLG